MEKKELNIDEINKLFLPILNDVRAIKLYVALIALVIIGSAYIFCGNVSISYKSLHIYSIIFMGLSLFITAYRLLLQAFVGSNIQAIVESLCKSNYKTRDIDENDVSLWTKKIFKEIKSNPTVRKNVDIMTEYFPFLIWSFCSILTLFICLNFYFRLRKYQFATDHRLYLSIPIFMNCITVLFNFFTLINLLKIPYPLKLTGFYPIDNFTGGMFEFLMFFASLFVISLVFRSLANKIRKSEKECEIGTALICEISDETCLEDESEGDFTEKYQVLDSDLYCDEASGDSESCESGEYECEESQDI